MRNILLIVCLGASCASASAEPLNWQRYSVPETSATVDLPTGLFSKDAGLPEQGRGRRFTTADNRATLAVQSTENKDHDTPAAYLAKKHPPSNIVYKHVTDDFFVVSSFRNDLIWYDRCNFAGRNISCVLVNYPAAEKRQWDGVITRISHSLSAG
jgi:hypothetical protein